MDIRRMEDLEPDEVMSYDVMLEELSKKRALNSNFA